MRVRVAGVVLAFAVGVVLLAGCEAQGPATVTGTVTFDGKPLKAGTVGFHPNKGMTPYYVIIQEDGSYSMTTDAVPNIPSGDYVVTVVGRVPFVQQPGMPGGQGKQLTPPKYADKTLTDLRATVRPGGNKIDFEVRSDGSTPAPDPVPKKEEGPGKA